MTLDTSTQLPNQIALERIWPSIKKRYARHKNKTRLVQFHQALVNEFPRLFDCLAGLYEGQWDFYFYLEALIDLSARAWLNSKGTSQPYTSDVVKWIESAECVGATGYVDLFADNLPGLKNKISYLNDLGVNYLHLMPFFDVPSGDSDGGYAIKDYGKVNPKFGTYDDLNIVAKELHNNGIRLVLDFVFNHTSDQHEWAMKAKSGDGKYQNYYWIFTDPNEKNRYSAHLRDIFPDKRPGCFTWSEELNADIWTTFNSFQWDLNYQNPEVFNAMCSEMLKLVDAGADVIRLDALAFTWKQIGTTCENLPMAHRLIQAFNAFLKISAPNVLLKSEAIVAPDDVVQYISEDECPLSYNPNFMALLWEALATRQTKLLIAGTQARTNLPNHSVWVNYLRCHDDIGWAFADADAWKVSINPQDHRHFLNKFYTNQFEGSFARGVPFQENPVDGDCRISGTLASLAGLEQGLNSQDDQLIDHALKRIELLHGIMLAFKGIPLIYLGDEMAMLNDYSYESHPDHHNDSRWVHRVSSDQALSQMEKNPVQQKFFTELKNMIAVRKSNPILGEGRISILSQAHEHLFIFTRTAANKAIYVIANLSEHNCNLNLETLADLRVPSKGVDLLTNNKIDMNKALIVKPYQQLWFAS